MSKSLINVASGIFHLLSNVQNSFFVQFCLQKIRFLHMRHVVDEKF